MYKVDDFQGGHLETMQPWEGAVAALVRNMDQTGVRCTEAVGQIVHKGIGFVNTDNFVNVLA